MNSRRRCKVIVSKDMNSRFLIKILAQTICDKDILFMLSVNDDISIRKYFSLKNGVTWFRKAEFRKPKTNNWSVATWYSKAHGVNMMGQQHTTRIPYTLCQKLLNAA